MAAHPVSAGWVHGCGVAWFAGGDACAGESVVRLMVAYPVSVRWVHGCGVAWFAGGEACAGESVVTDRDSVALWGFLRR